MTPADPRPTRRERRIAAIAEIVRAESRTSGGYPRLGRETAARIAERIDAELLAKGIVGR